MIYSYYWHWFKLLMFFVISRAVKRSHCFHKNGHNVGCHSANNPFMIIFGIVEIILSQIPDFHELTGLSILAAIMSFGYASIGIGLSIAKIAGYTFSINFRLYWQFSPWKLYKLWCVLEHEGGGHVRTSITGVTVGVDVTSNEKLWNTFQALGNIAFAYAFSMVLVEIQASSNFLSFI